MARLPKGLKKVTKKEFINKTLALKDEQNMFSSELERVGVEWAKTQEINQSKKSIRW